MERRDFLVVMACAAFVPKQVFAVQDRKKVCVTIDDGLGQIGEFTDLFLAKDIPATYFLAGLALSHKRREIEEALASGLQIGCHTWSHTPASKMSIPDFRSDLIRWRREFEGLFGSENLDRVKVFRFPYGDTGKSRRSEFENVVYDFGWAPFGWNIQITPGGKRNPGGFGPYQDWPSRVVSLSHFREGDVKRTEKFLDEGIRNGAEFVYAAEMGVFVPREYGV